MATQFDLALKQRDALKARVAELEAEKLNWETDNAYLRIRIRELTRRAEADFHQQTTKNGVKIT